MRTTKPSIPLSVVLSLAVFILSLPVSTAAQTESVLFSITGGLDGSNPRGGVISDVAGNLYGTSQYGGNFTNCRSTGCGAVWEISPAIGGGWTETVLHTFTGSTDGANPYAGLVRDAAGNLYGTAANGGNLSVCFGSGCGVVFELSPNSSGGWTETVLHTFSGGRDGAGPWTGLIFDAAGNLYGTAISGGNLTASACAPYGCGIVFKLSPNSSGGWTETVLHAFTGGYDGGYPFGTLTFDAAGNLYGTTEGGANPICGYNVTGCGVVFKLSPPVSGSQWKENVLHAFHGSDGNEPESGVVFDGLGNLYGMTAFGGESFGCDGAGCGVVFKLIPTVSGPWKFTGLHVFSDHQISKGFYPLGDLLLDVAGNVYGTASGGGTVGCGIVFKLSPTSSGGWIEAVVHSFTCGSGPDGAVPTDGLISDAAGNLYGTTSAGGPNQAGTVFKIVP
jgi:uncharacterized repeat protein (TIGR03803 family)